MKSRIIVLLLITSFIFSCEKDEPISFVESSKDLQVPTMSKIDASTIRANKKLYEKLSSYNTTKNETKSIDNRTVYDSVNDFIVDVESAMYIEHDEYHSYTFSVYTDNLTYTENLYLSYDISTDSYTAYRTSYDLNDTEREMALDGLQPLEISGNLIAIEKLDVFNNSILNRNDPVEILVPINGFWYVLSYETVIVNGQPPAAVGIRLDMSQFTSPPSNNEPVFVDVPSASGFVAIDIIIVDHGNNNVEYWEPDDWTASGGGTFSFVNNQIVYFPNITTVPAVNHPQEVLRMLSADDGNNLLTPEELPRYNWITDHNNRVEVNALYDYLDNNRGRDDEPTLEAKDFVEEIIDAGIDNSLLSALPFFQYPPEFANQYKQDYPKLTEYLQNQLPKVADIDLIVETIALITDQDLSEIKKDLQWGNGPEIKIVQLDNFSANTSTNTVGHFTPNSPNVLHLDIDYVNTLENETANQYEKDAFLFFLGTTVLHEYVHYGDNLDGEDYHYPGDEGTLFEILVYGQNVTSSNAALILNKD